MRGKELLSVQQRGTWAGIDPKNKRDELKGVFFSGNVFVCQVTLREQELNEAGAAPWWLDRNVAGPGEFG